MVSFTQYMGSADANVSQLFSALYSMLPAAKRYFISGGYSPGAASYALIGLFLGGAIGIQFLSRVLHHFMPSHIVDCDHTHDEDLDSSPEEMEEHHHENHIQGIDFFRPRRDGSTQDDEQRPLLSAISSHEALRSVSEPTSAINASHDQFDTAPTSRRQSLFPGGLTRTLTALTVPRKRACDETGPCMGYSDPCGQECFNTASRRGSMFPQLPRSSITNLPTKVTTTTHHRIASPVLEDDEEDRDDQGNAKLTKANIDAAFYRSRASTKSSSLAAHRSRSSTHHYHHPPHEHPYVNGRPRQPSEFSRPSEGHDDCIKSRPTSTQANTEDSGHEAHHHHVPSNAFMSIGLQTSIAIALHKIPEGFITYATNHANPTLGFAVFMALFIHNITEGFALALPLYLALQSRVKAISWASFLGGVSQPLGAGIAALWFKIANGGGPMAEPGERVYGGMFAVTSGVMTSVALQLFSESLGLTHNKSLCIGFAFSGMGILGLSSALTA